MKIEENAWVKSFPGAITVSDTQGIILEINDVSERVFKEDGGRALIGKNMLECHPGPARTKLEKLMKEQKTNVYTIEKNGKKKLIYQTPWYKDGVYAGFVELALEINRRVGPRKEDLITPAQLIDQAQHVAVRCEPVMIELLQRPVPMRRFEPGCQPADPGRALIDGHLVSRPVQIVSGGQSGHPRPDNCDALAATHKKRYSSTASRSSSSMSIGSPAR